MLTNDPRTFPPLSPPLRLSQKNMATRLRKNAPTAERARRKPAAKAPRAENASQPGADEGESRKPAAAAPKPTAAEARISEVKSEKSDPSLDERTRPTFPVRASGFLCL